MPSGWHVYLRGSIPLALWQRSSWRDQADDHGHTHFKGRCRRRRARIFRTINRRKPRKFGNDRVAHVTRADQLAALRLDVGGAQSLVEGGGNRLVDQIGFPAAVEGIAQRHPERGDHGDRVGHPLAGDVGRRTVHRLVHRLALLRFRIDLAERRRRQHPERAGEHRRDVGEHVAEQVVGDDHVELLGPAHQLHAAGIGKLMLELDVLVFTRMHLLHDLVPEHAGFDDVALLHRGHLVAALARKLEGDAGDAFDLVGIVDLSVDGTFLAIAEIGDGLRVRRNRRRLSIRAGSRCRARRPPRA